MVSWDSLNWISFTVGEVEHLCMFLRAPSMFFSVKSLLFPFLYWVVDFFPFRLYVLYIGEISLFNINFFSSLVFCLMALFIVAFAMQSVAYFYTVEFINLLFCDFLYLGLSTLPD